MAKTIVIDLSELSLGDIMGFTVGWICVCGHENLTSPKCEIFECAACGRFFRVQLDAKVVFEEISKKDFQKLKGKKQRKRILKGSEKQK